MAIQSLERAKTLRGFGVKLGREGMSERVLAAVADFEKAGKSYKGAMFLAGRLKAIAAMAKSDDYWDEQVGDGFVAELRNIPRSQPIPSSRADHCGCEACEDGTLHLSDCAVHNEPAYPNGPCDCGAATQPIPDKRGE